MIANFVISITSVLLIYGWIFGINLLAKWHAIFPIFAVVLHLISTKRILPFPPRVASNLKFFPFFYIGILVVLEYTQFIEGAQGVDFAIFTQSIDTAARTGALQTSLLGLRYVNFLTHHFSPILYIPALLSLMGCAAPIAGIFVHGLSIACMYLAAYKIARASQWNVPNSHLICAILFLHPSLRVGLSWEIRDEIFALPFLGFAYLEILRSKYMRATFLLAATMLCKETFFVIAPLVAVSGCLHAFAQKDAKRGNSVFAAFALFTLGMIALILYFKVLPQTLFTPTFSPVSRIATVDELLSYEVLLQKALWILKVFAPLCFVPFFVPKIWKYALPAIVPIGAIAVSGFDPMFDPLNYYAVVPVYILGISLIIGIGLRFPLIAECAFDSRWAFTTIVLSLCIGARHVPASEIRRGLNMREYARQLREFISPDSTVVANDYDLAVLWDSRHLTRLFHAKQQKVNFDYVVSRVGQEDEIPKYIQLSSTECFRNPVWFVRCAAPAHSSSVQ